MLERITPHENLVEWRPSEKRRLSDRQSRHRLQNLTTRFRDAFRKSVEGIIEAGRVLIDAKNELEHGQFIDWVQRDLRFGTGQEGDRGLSLRKAQMLMFVAKNEVISNTNHWFAFPPSWRSALSARNGVFMLVSERLSRPSPNQSPHRMAASEPSRSPTTPADNSSKQQSRAPLVVVSATATGLLRARLAVAATTPTPPTIDHRERLWDRGAQSRPAHPLFFSKKTCRHQGDVEATHIDGRFTPKADIAQHRPHVRLVPIGHHLTAQ